jgi:hypothetical protein
MIAGVSVFWKTVFYNPDCRVDELDLPEGKQLHVCDGYKAGCIVKER